MPINHPLPVFCTVTSARFSMHGPELVIASVLPSSPYQYTIATLQHYFQNVKKPSMEPRKRKWKKPKFHLPGSKLTQFNVRCTTEQKEAIKAIADTESERMSLSELVLQRVLGIQPKRRKAPGNLERFVKMQDALARLASLAARQPDKKALFAEIKDISNLTHECIDYDSKR